MRPGGRCTTRVGVAIACSMALPALAHAAPPAADPIMVVEVHAGRRPADADRFMNPLRDELERRGFAARPETLGRLLAGRLPRPGILDRDRTTADILGLLDAGYEAFTSARFDQAVVKLTKALDEIERNPALLVIDTGHLAMVHKAYVGLSLSQGRLGLADQATATMAALIRMIRAQPLSRAEHGPAAAQLAGAVYQQVSSRDRGRLYIDTGNPRAMIFVDRRLRGMGQVMLDRLIPGVYRVLVQEPQTVGLSYEVEVPERGEVQLDAAWDADTSLIAGPEWFGFELQGDAEGRGEARFAVSLARRWTRQARVAVVGTARLEGTPALIGTLYLTTGEVLRSAAVALDSADGAALGALAAFLADGTRAGGLRVLDGGAVVAAGPARRSWPPPAALLAAGGVAAVIAGGVLLALDTDVSPEGRQKPVYLDSATRGLGVGIAGVAALGAGIWWWARSGRPGSAPLAAVGRSGAMIGWARRF
jgi:hypothetical protein